MSDYTEFFLSSSSSVVQLELIEITHPNFSQVYRIVRNATAGVTVTLEDASQATFTYYPIRIKPLSSNNDLDQMISIVFGELGEVVPTEIQNVVEENGFGTKPSVIYRTYRSDDLTAPLFGPWNLEIVDMTLSREGASFQAKAPTINATRTGELYLPERFPGLGGFFK